MCPLQEGRTPFVGPRPIQKGELLFGRDKEVSDLVDLLFSERIVLLHSPSGAGKSSLVNASLIPALEGEYLQILPVIRLNNELPAGFTGQDELAKANRYVLSTMLSLEPALPDSGHSTPSDLASISLDQYLGGIDPDEALVLILDQFEEVLTLDPLDLDAKHEFFRQLGEALRNRRCCALFAVREDYVGSLDPYLQPIPTQLSVRMRLDLLSKEAAQQAIQRPRPAGADEDLHLLTDNFTPEAAGKLAEDLAQICVQQPDGSRLPEPGLHVEPVQLQVVCERLWRQAQERGESQVGIDALKDVGTVDEALAGYFAEKVKAIANQRGVPERRIRRWFDQQLITAQGIRGQVMRGVDESEGLDNEVIEDLIDAYLVRQERRRGVTWFELAHDRLIEPVRKDNAAWQKDELTEQQRTASVWDQQGQPESFFLRGKDLAKFEKWAAKHDQELEEFERKLLNVSQDHRKGETRLRILAMGLGVMLIVAVVAAFFSGIQANSAKQQHATAQAALYTADAALNKVATSDFNAWATGLAAATSQNKAAAAQATSDQLRQTLEAVGTPMTMTLEQRQTVEVLQAEATAAQATADQLRSTADVASTAATAAQQTAEAERATAVQGTMKEQPTPTETPTVTPSLTPSPTSTDTPRPTSTPFPRPTARTQPQSMFTLVPITCAAEPVGKFLAIWQGLKEWLGCPRQTQPAEWTPMAKQQFERGFMFWSQQPTDLVLVVVPASQGRELTWSEYRAWSFVYGSARCASQFSPGPGQVRPINAFGGVWCDNKAVRDTLGWAVGDEYSIQGTVQEFDQGFLLRDETGQVWVLFRSGGLQTGMALIPGGMLQMGSPEGEGDEDEHPQHSVTISSFWMDLTEVTNREYRACEAAGACKAPHDENGQLKVDSVSHTGYHTDPRWDRYPVIFVSWSDAETYCEWLGKRLPTEAEWEWAAGGSDERRYPWGNQEPDDSRARFLERPSGDMRQVGSYAAGANGLYDMAGNVWEWTSSLYKDYPYSRQDGREDPRADGVRVLRGGSWRDDAKSLRVTNRNVGTAPDWPLDNVGFRCVRSAK